MYGLQRMPVTLYMEQWDRLLNFADDLRAFIKDHEGQLKRKEKYAATGWCLGLVLRPGL